MIRRALAALAIAGCFWGGSRNQGDQLADAVREYADGVRWDRPDAAMARLPLAARASFQERADKARDEVSFAEYELQRAVIEKPGEAKVRVQFSWTSKKEWVVRKTLVEQTWRMASGDRWTLVDERRVSGEPNVVLGAPAREAARDAGAPAAARDGGAPSADGS